jgi:hypothetical protein
MTQIVISPQLPGREQLFFSLNRCKEIPLYEGDRSRMQ